MSDCNVHRSVTQVTLFDSWFERFDGFRHSRGNSSALVICLPDPRRKYHVKILAVSQAGDGYQTDQTMSTPGCLCKCTAPQFITRVLKRYQSWDIIRKFIPSAAFQLPETKLQRPRRHRITWPSLPATLPPCRCAGAVLPSRPERQWATQCAAHQWAPTTPRPSATYRCKKHSDFFTVTFNAFFL